MKKRKINPQNPFFKFDVKIDSDDEALSKRCIPKKTILVNPKINQCKKVKRKTIQKCPSDQKFLKIPRKVNKLVKKMNQSPAKHLMIQTLNQKSQTIWNSKKCMFTKRNWRNIKLCWPNGMKINKKKNRRLLKKKWIYQNR